MTKELENLEFGFFPLFNLSSEHSLQISGIALAEGIWKNVIYSPEEIEKATAELVGKPIKVEHGMDKEFGSKIVGKVIEALFDKVLKAIKFKANIEDPIIKERVTDGIYKAVSMSTWMDKIPTKEESIKEGKDFKFAELSLVKNPACEKCFIFHCEQLSKQEDPSGIGEEIMNQNSDNEDNQMLEDYSKAYENLEKEKERIKEELARMTEKHEMDLDAALLIVEEKVALRKELSQVKEQLSKELDEKKEKEKLMEEINNMIKENEEKAKLDPELEEMKAAYPKDYEEYPYVKGQTYPMECPACGKSFDNPKDFFAHWITEHKEKYGKFELYYPKYQGYYPQYAQYPFKYDYKYGKKYQEKQNLEELNKVYRRKVAEKMIEIFDQSTDEERNDFTHKPQLLFRQASDEVIFGHDMKLSVSREMNSSKKEQSKQA